MRLFLSSENLGKYPEAFIELVGDNNKLAFIENAKDDWTIDDRSEKLQEHKHQFRQLGFDVHELDLRDFFGKADKLEDWIKDFGGVFAAGGNSFILRRAMAQSGLDKILPKMLANNSLAYGGSSAGAIVATPSLRGSEHGDYPKTIPKHYEKKIIWKGLSLVPFYVVPHYKSDWWGKEADQMAQKLKAKNLKYYTLRDGQVIVVEAGKIEYLK